MSITAEQLAEIPALIAACRISGDHETLAAAATDLLAEVERLREHSTLLNSAMWQAAVALGEVPAGADRIEHDPTRIDRLIERLADANTVIGSLGSQLAAVKAELERMRAQRLLTWPEAAEIAERNLREMEQRRIDLAEREGVWYGRLDDDEPSEPEDDDPPCQQGCGKTATSWGVCDDHMPDVPGEPERAEGGWLIWSNYHHAWWGPNAAGYRRDAREAGRWDSFDEATARCGRTWEPGKPPPEVVIARPADPIMAGADAELLLAQLIKAETRRRMAERHIATQHAEQGGE